MIRKCRVATFSLMMCFFLVVLSPLLMGPENYGRIAFVSSRDCDWEIKIMDSDGSNIRGLTDNFTYDSYPAWSLDGSMIAFVSDRDGNYEIYSMDNNGEQVERLTYDPASDVSPAWSPDGTKIAFVSDRDG
ncbi:MAG: PD40 domain-containing protein, partial [Theionarchaea archaeon]|nr:PD40 domain-containing protein [Theionarchaea archaeon]